MSKSNFVFEEHEFFDAIPEDCMAWEHLVKGEECTLCKECPLNKSIWWKIEKCKSKQGISV